MRPDYYRCWIHRWEMADGMFSADPDQLDEPLYVLLPDSERSSLITSEIHQALITRYLRL